MNTNKKDPVAADMYAFAAAVLGEVIERFPAPSAAPEVRGAFQGLRRLISFMHSYHLILATGSPSDIENWRRDGARIRAEVSVTFQSFLDAGLPGLGTGPRLDERVGRADREPEVERGLGHGAD